MASLDHSHSHSTAYLQTRHCYYYTPPPPSASASRSFARSMRTFRSNIFHNSPNLSQNLTDSAIDLHLQHLANKPSSNSQILSPSEIDDVLDNISHSSSSCSSDMSGELQRLSELPDPEWNRSSISDTVHEPCSGFLRSETFSSEIIECISPEDLQPAVKLCIDGLQSPAISIKRPAAEKLRVLAKNRADNRVLIGESGAIPALIPLLRCSDAMTQEHSVTALLNLSLHERNKSLIMNAASVKSLIYVLKTGTEISKQNAACCLLSLALIDDNKLSIGASGAIPPLVALLINGSNRGKKDALTTLYKLCSERLNKERTVAAGAVRPLVDLVGEKCTGLVEKAIVVLSSLAGIEMGSKAIVEAGGFAVLIEAIEDASDKVKEFAVLTLLQLCRGNVSNRELLVREGGVPPLVALSLNGMGKAKHKAETLLGYMREAKPEASSSIT